MLLSHNLSRNASNCASNLSHQNGNIAVSGLINRYFNFFKKAEFCFIEIFEEINFSIVTMYNLLTWKFMCNKTMMKSISHDDLTFILRTKRNWPASTDQFIFSHSEKNETPHVFEMIKTLFSTISRQKTSDVIYQYSKQGISNA
jgi:hypothetical protein